MAEATDRPQDGDRPHRRRARPSAETASLLAAWHDTLRSELADVIKGLAPVAPEPGLLDGKGLAPAEPKRPPVKERAALLDIGIKVARELGAAIEPGPEGSGAAAPARRRRGRVDYGP